MLEKQVEAYSLFEFCQKVQENILNGFKFDFESNARFPTAFGTMLVAGMVKDGVPDVKVEVVSEDKEEPSVKSVSTSRKSRKVEVE